MSASKFISRRPNVGCQSGIFSQSGIPGMGLKRKISRALGTIEYRSLESPSEKARYLRDKFDCPQSEIARALGCTQASVSRYLSGKRTGATRGRPGFLSKSDEKQLVHKVIEAHRNHDSMSFAQIHDEVSISLIIVF